MAEHPLRKREVVGSTPTGGFLHATCRAHLSREDERKREKEREREREIESKTCRVS